MRPRHYAGESHRAALELVPTAPASMRPRHYAGESGVQHGCAGIRSFSASMRPRHYAGESALPLKRQAGCWTSFNEAPALRRGKSGDAPPPPPGDQPASMRPRHYAGESIMDQTGMGEKPVASMRPRHYAGESGFEWSRSESGIEASMRPRHYAGESASRLPVLFGVVPGQLQ